MEFSIKISGEGTKMDIRKSLIQIMMSLDDTNESGNVFEDEFLCAEIEPIEE